MNEDFDPTPLEREVRPEEVRTAAGLADLLNVHRTALLAGRASADGVEQMKREIAPLLARGRAMDASASAVQSPDRGELDRYFDGERLNLRDWKRTVYLGG